MTAEAGQIAVDWYAVVSLVVGSVAATGVISAYASHRLMIRQLNRKRDMDFIKDKIDLYAKLIHDLNEMRDRYDAIMTSEGLEHDNDSFAYPVPEWEPIVHMIDSRLNEHPFLINPLIHKKWVFVKTRPKHSQAKQAMREMRKLLITEYNALRSKYLGRLYDIVPPIPDDINDDKSSTPQ